MKITFRIRYDNAEVRNGPSIGNTLIRNISKSDRLYTGSIFLGGWYYSEEIKGWLASESIIVHSIVDDSSSSSGDSIEVPIDENDPSIYIIKNIDKLISAINNHAYEKIDPKSIKVCYMENNKRIETTLDAFISKFITLSDSAEDIYEKLKDFKIPAFKTEENKVLYVENGELTWKHVTEIIPENKVTILTENEF